MRLPENYSGATSDKHLVQLWLSGRPENTAIAYSRDAQMFLEFLESENVGLQEAKVDHVVRYAESLVGSPATKARRIRSVKSLMKYAHQTGYTVFNVALILKAPSVRDTLHERILNEETVQGLLAAAEPGRNYLLIKLLYAAGSRITETVNLTWADLSIDRVTFHGKGGKTRTVKLSAQFVNELRKLRWKNDTDHSLVFKSRRGNPLCVREARQIIYETADAIGEKASPHWLRHAHASHALDNGAPIHLVQATLGHANVATTSRYLHARPNEGSSQFLNL